MVTLLCIIKTLSMVPFIVYEYYLIMFEHIFVDTSHFMSSINSMTFLSNNSPALKKQSSIKKDSKYGDVKRESEVD